MSETPSNTNDDLEKQVEEKAHELLVERLALGLISHDPRFRSTIRKRAVAEQETFHEHPWGIDYLKQDNGVDAILERVRARQAQEQENQADNTESEQEEALEAEIADARQITLALGEFTAQKLNARGIPADIQVLTEKVREEKRISKEGVRLHGKLRTMVPVTTSESKVTGWELPLSGQVDRFAKIILCENGRILTAYGRYEEKKTENGKNRLYVKPNAAEQPKRPSQTYSAFLDTRPGSDLGMANLPVNTPVTRGHIVLGREQAMQEAIVSLLVKHEIPIEDEAPTLEI